MMLLVLRILAGFTAGLCVTLVLRRALRRLCGPGCAYGTWALPLVTGLAAALPKLHWTPELPTGMPMTLHAVMTAATSATASVNPLPLLVFAIWAVGTVALLLRLTRHYLRLHRDMRFLRDDVRDSILATCPGIPPNVLREHEHGPAVVAGVPSRIVLPADFISRFDHEQRQLVLLHETTHLHCGDAWWNLLAELLCALLWFHPLVWFARPRFRLDQELACDAYVLQRHPQARHGYARALFQGIDRPVVPALAAWLDQPHLKERLHMIHDLAQCKTHRRTGFLVVVGLLTGSVFAAQAMQATPAPARTPSTPDPTPSVRTTKQPSPIVLLHPDQAPVAAPSIRMVRQSPIYPADARKKHIEGTVVLLIKVGTDGGPLQIKPVPGKAAPELVKAAIKAAEQWQFNPATNAKGQPVVAWTKIPVVFKLPAKTKPK